MTAAATTTATMLLSLVIRFLQFQQLLRVHSSKYLKEKKMRWRDEKKLRYKDELLKPKDIEKRSRVAAIFRRNDIQLCESFWLIDPRDERYQKNLEETRGYMDREINGKTDIQKRKDITREMLGYPPPPVSVYERSMAQLRSNTASSKGIVQETAAPAEKDKKDKKGEGEKLPDFSTIELEYMAYKGMQLTRKQQAQFAAKPATVKKDDKGSKGSKGSKKK